MYRSGLPYFAKGEVVKGFQRGSKDLGCPTANFPPDVVNNLPAEVDTGVFFGFAQVDGGDVHGMVMSIGWNPVYGNKTKSMEVHILHEFEHDFYDKELRVIVLGYIRPERNFDSLEELTETIKSDIEMAQNELLTVALQKYKNHSFFNRK